MLVQPGEVELGGSLETSRSHEMGTSLGHRARGLSFLSCPLILNRSLVLFVCFFLNEGWRCSSVIFKKLRDELWLWFSWRRACLACLKPWVPSPACHKLGVVANTCSAGFGHYTVLLKAD